MAVTIRKNDVKASNLILLGYGLITLSFFIQIQPAFKKILTSKSPEALLLGGLFALAYLGGMVVGVRRGYRWVKIFFVVSAIWDILRYIYAFPPADGLTIRTGMFLVALAGRAWALAIVTRDLLRRPVAGEAGVSESGHNLLD